MLKYYDMISKLSDAQKIRIITNVGNLSGKDLKILGIPRIKPGYMKDYGRGFYPHAASLSHSWDTELWHDVAAARLADMVHDGVDLAIVPGAKIKVSPYRKELSEDTYLSSVMSGVYSGTAESLGAVSLLSGYYLTEADVEWMDTEPSERVINEQIVGPYIKALGAGGARAVLTDTRTLPDAYAPIAKDMLRTAEGAARFVICDKATDENTVELVTRGVICLSASANALDGAYSKYKRLKQQIERGRAEETTLIDSVRNHSAVSPEQLDSALDKILDLLFECQASHERLDGLSSPDTDALAYRAALSSSVLLKNSGNILPLGKDVTVGVIGDLFGEGDAEGTLLDKCKAAFETRGYKLSGVSRGYDTADLYCEELTDDAVSLCERSDAVILIMGVARSGEREITKTETLSLPANQLYLAHKLKRTGKRIIAVVSSAYSFDVEFSRPLDALLFVPLETAYGAAALADIVSGEYNPSGKLAYTIPAGSDTAFAKRAMYKREYGLRAGPFIGYRYYDTAGITVGYPFGHGLSYSKFQYSELSVRGRTVTFTVRNVSDRRGTEIAEIYIGAEHSSVIRPKRELCGFIRMELDPGESRTFSADIEIPKVYADGRYVTEKGTYTVWVGASVSDIKLKAELTADGESLSPDGERLIDYIQSKPNITEDKFTLEADFSFMKRSYKNITCGVLALALAIALTVFNTVMEMSSGFLGIVSAILAVGAIVFFVMEARERSRLHEEERARIDEANKEHFEGAEEIPNLNASRLFHDEFDATDVSIAERERVTTDDIVEDSTLGFTDDGFLMPDLIGEFLQFASERGYKFARQTAENLFASLATSKLIVTNMPEGDFNDCMVLLAEYFDCDPFVENDASFTDDSSDAFYAFDANGDKIRRIVHLALSSSSCVPEKIHVSAVNGAKSETVNKLLNPFMRYINAPKAKNQIEMYNELGVNVGYTISPNLWFVINLGEGESAESLPLSVTRAAALNDIKFTRSQPSDTRTFFHVLNRYQLEYISERARGKADISEEMWRKVDKLEKYAMTYSDYRIGNKLWLNLERHIAMLLSSGAEVADATDMAIATRLLPSISSVLRDNPADKDQSLADAVEFIFGAENTAYSKEIIKNMLTARSDKRTAAKAPSVNEDVKADATDSGASIEA